MSDEKIDLVNHPPHYTQGGSIEAIDYIFDSMGKEGFTYYCEGAVKKYIHRWRHKNGIEDLQKAIWYLNKIIEVENADVE